MQGEILLVNPRKRRRRSRTARNAMGRFVKTHRATRKNRRRRRRNPVAAIAANPRRRRRRNPVAAFAANPRRRRRHRRVHVAGRRHRRRNPRFALGGGSLTKQLIQAGIGGVGAVALDVGLGYLGNLPAVPDMLKTGPLKPVVRVVGALGLGYLVGKVRPAWKMPVTAGALAVTAYFILRDLTAKFAPALPLQGYMEGDYTLAYVDPAPALEGYRGGMGAYMQPGGDLGAYMQPGGSEMGNMTNDGM